MRGFLQLRKSRLSVSCDKTSFDLGMDFPSAGKWIETTASIFKACRSSCVRIKRETCLNRAWGEMIRRRWHSIKLYSCSFIRSFVRSPSLIDSPSGVCCCQCWWERSCSPRAPSDSSKKMEEVSFTHILHKWSEYSGTERDSFSPIAFSDAYFRPNIRSYVFSNS